MTIILTLVGLVVFFVSLFKVGFKAAFKRLTTFTLTGLVLDVLIWLGALTVVLVH